MKGVSLLFAPVVKGFGLVQDRWGVSGLLIVALIASNAIFISLYRYESKQAHSATYEAQIESLTQTLSAVVDTHEIEERVFEDREAQFIKLYTQARDAYDRLYESRLELEGQLTESARKFEELERNDESVKEYANGAVNRAAIEWLSSQY
tara:strand:- start:52 stop:501 length:450 start_codon:yes stop_codon:yes gene_type:complete